jgi:hypothetical protein
VIDLPLTESVTHLQPHTEKLERLCRELARKQRRRARMAGQRGKGSAESKAKKKKKSWGDLGEAKNGIAERKCPETQKQIPAFRKGAAAFGQREVGGNKKSISAQVLLLPPPTRPQPLCRQVAAAGQGKKKAAMSWTSISRQEKLERLNRVKKNSAGE